MDFHYIHFSLQGLKGKMRKNLGGFQRDFSYYECFFPLLFDVS